MTYKRTWLSCLLWAVFTCITGVLLAHYAILFWKREINSATGYGTICFVLLIFAVVAGCYFLSREALISVIKKHRINEYTAFLWEIFAVLSLFFAGLLYRIYLYLLCSMDGIAATEYYQMATVKAGGQVETIVHGASYLYTVCLSFILSFLGNRVMAAVWVQILIQMFTILITYFTVKKMVGRIPACITMLVFAFSPVYTKQIFTITPECFLFMLYLAGMFVIGSYVRKYCSSRFSTVTMIFGAIFSGIVIGALTYLDALSLTLCVPLIGLFTGVHRADEGTGKYKAEISEIEKSRTDDNRIGESEDGKGQTDRVEEDRTKKNPAVGVSILAFLLIIITSIFTVAGMFALDAYISGAEIEKVASAWLDLYLNHMSVNYEVYQVGSSVTGCFILVALAALLILAFWVCRGIQNATPWICLMLLLAPTPLAVTGVLAYKVYSVFFWSVLAGIGVQQSLVLETTESAVSEISGSEQTMQDTPVPAPVSEPHMQDTPVLASVSKPRFIENPLPLPKKHERKEMDYQYEVTADKMKFDVDVKDDDDFDIL